MKCRRLLTRTLTWTLLVTLSALPMLAESPPSAETAEEALGVDVAAEPLETPLDAPLDRPLETLAADRLERGQKGYGLSVFAGDEPERFEVEVLGLWRGPSAEMSYILARLSGQDLERSGVMQGMSGSPVFVDGKLIGAVSFSFNFGLDPIAGITPIDSMRSLASAGGGVGDALGGGEQPTPTAAWSRSPSVAIAAAPELVPSFDALLERRVDVALLDAHLKLLAPPASPAGATRAISWSAGGFASGARELLGERLSLVPLAGGGLVGGGAGESGSSEQLLAAGGDLGPGDAVALVLVRGDLSLAAHGTVTDRVGDSIFAFGHPVYSLGPIRLPMARSEVITTIPSLASSFKLSNAGDLIGVFDQDREPGAHGVLGAEPKLVPMAIELRGLAERDYRLELADSPLFKPTLIAVSALGALNSGSYATGLLGLDVKARLSLAGHDDLLIEQSFDGNQAAMNAVVHLLTFAAFLEMNEQQPTAIESIELMIEQAPAPRLAKLLGARAEKARVEPGESVKVWLDIQPQRGERERRALEVTIPENVPPGRYWVMVGDGTSMDAARLLIEKRKAETFDQQLAMMRSLHSRKELHFLGLTASQGRSLAGGVMPDLPPSMRAIYGGEGQGLQLRIVEERIQPWEVPLEGVYRLDFEVEDAG